MRELRWATASLVVVLVLGCGRPSPEAAPKADSKARPTEDAYRVESELAAEPPPAASPARSRARAAAEEEARAAGVLAVRGRPPRAAAKVAAADAELAPQDAQPDEATRTWFPDAFVWEPVVETDADGVAVVDVRVPDTLTDWRVLGLAHDRTGQQAGAIASFASRLPLAADPRVPAFLHVGDRVELPVRAANTTERAISAELTVAADGGLSGGGRRSLRLAASSGEVATITLAATAAGDATVLTRLSGDGLSDQSERVVRVTPRGRPVRSTTRGTLADGVSVAPPVLGDGISDEQIELMVFPGPMAVVQAEVDRLAAGGRAGIAGGAFHALDHLERLGEASGVTVDAGALRKQRLLAWQRVATAGPSGSTLDAADRLLALSPRDATGGVAAARPGLVRQVVGAQRPDGTWSSATRAPLQRVIVETAYAAMALPSTERTARLRAEGALERHVQQIGDPWTAAVVLGSGLLRGATAEPLRTTLAEAVQVADDGSVRFELPEGVVDARGQRPAETAALAWATLALVGADEHAELRGRLVSELVARWQRVGGFGAGAHDLIALDAVVAALPVPAAATRVALMVGDREVAVGQVDPSRPAVPLLLSAPGGEAQVTLDPPLDGLAYRATRVGYAPWPEAQRIAGVEWRWLEAEPALQVGVESVVTLELAGPPGAAFSVERGLPAGANVDVAALSAQPSVAWAEVLEDRVRVRTAPIPGSGGLKVQLRVTPGIAGDFGAAPTRFEVGGQVAVMEGQRWRVR